MQPALYRSLSRRGAELVPQYLTAQDQAWLEVLLDGLGAYVGRPRRDWDERLRSPLALHAPRSKLGWACAVLEQLTDRRDTSKPSARNVRATLFRAAAALGREAAVERAAAALALAPAALFERLLSDLPSERALGPLPPGFTAAELALAANAALVGALLKQSRRVEIDVWGSPRHVLRQARRLGLVAVVRRGARPGSVNLDVSGPLLLFRHTQVYGRALASLLPRLVAAGDFALRAECRVSSAQCVTVAVGGGDPIAPAAEGTSDVLHDAAFAAAFAERTRDWALRCEPGEIDAGGALIVPDFEIVSVTDPARRWFVELAGYWTPAVIEQRLAALRAAGVARYIVCVDARRDCGEVPSWTSPYVVRYEKRLDVARLLGVIEAPDYSTMP